MCKAGGMLTVHLRIPQRRVCLSMCVCVCTCAPRPSGAQRVNLYVNLRMFPELKKPRVGEGGRHEKGESSAAQRCSDVFRHSASIAGVILATRGVESGERFHFAFKVLDCESPFILRFGEWP